MNHLGDDVAAYVDGQLEPEATAAATRHLQRCQRCELAVRQQRRLKDRVRTAGQPELPPWLRDALERTPPPTLSDPAIPPSWWRRVLGPSVLGVGVVVAWAALVVAATAYLVGGSDESSADIVDPSYDDFASRFTAARAVPVAVSTADIEESALADLRDHGWSCEPVLAERFERTRSQWLDEGRTLSLSYADGLERVRVFQQVGSLDPGTLDGFEQATLGGHGVWLRSSRPHVVTWAADGLVYAVVAEVEESTLDAIVADLPSPAAEPGPIERVRTGLVRLARSAS